MRDRSPVFADETRQVVGAVFSWRLIPVSLWNRTETAVWVDVFCSEHHQSKAYISFKSLSRTHPELISLLLWNRTEAADFFNVFCSENHQSNTDISFKILSRTHRALISVLLWHRPENIKKLKKIQVFFSRF